MCSDCEDFDPECSYCGLSCGGSSEDLDKCPSCWMQEIFDGYDPAPCFERDDGVECKCDCHEEDIEAWKDVSGIPEEMYEQINEDLSKMYNPKLQPGVFPFLKLPGELRDKIYHYHLKAYGHRRKSTYYKGTVDTALLGTCRQINKEARHLPLSINMLSFVSPFQAYRFLGFKVQPAQKQLIKSVHVDVHGIQDFHATFAHYLVVELAKLSSLSLSHLSITLQGRIEADWFTKDRCFEICLLEVKGLASFDLIIGSRVIKDVTKGKIVDALRKKLLKASEPATNPLKRKASADVPMEETAVPSQGSKKVATTKSRKTGERKAKTEKLSPSKEDITGPSPDSVNGLMKKYDRLVDYARAYDPEASSVKIGLEKAREAANEGKNEDLERLAEDILSTLEAQYARIATAHNLVPYQLSSPLQ